MASTAPQVIDGIYQKGVIKLLDKVDLKEDELIKVTIVRRQVEKTGEPNSLLGAFPELKEITDEDIEEAKKVWERGLMAGRHNRPPPAEAEIHRQLEYKAKWAGIEIVKADQWFPSSKMCSACGAVKDVLDLSERMYVCAECDSILARDLNAALNLRNMAASSAVTACGACVRPVGQWAKKQEPNT